MLLSTNTSTVGLMSSQWSSSGTVQIWKIPKRCEVFSEKFDKIQDQLQSISCMDELLSGKCMLNVHVIAATRASVLFVHQEFDRLIVTDS